MKNFTKNLNKLNILIFFCLFLFSKMNCKTHYKFDSSKKSDWFFLIFKSILKIIENKNSNYQLNSNFNIKNENISGSYTEKSNRENFEFLKSIIINYSPNRLSEIENLENYEELVIKIGNEILSKVQTIIKNINRSFYFKFFIKNYNNKFNLENLSLNDLFFLEKLITKFPNTKNFNENSSKFLNNFKNFEDETLTYLGIKKSSNLQKFIIRNKTILKLCAALGILTGAGIFIYKL